MQDRTIKELVKDGWIFFQKDSKIESLERLEYGEVTFKFKEGRIYQVAKTETF
ncbi:TPA: DUF2292 domain-containing protein [Streptococcus pyogenes]|nr:DUF2292 domain-containing protein [Streptococcus pyogenes]